LTAGPGLLNLTCEQQQQATEQRQFRPVFLLLFLAGGRVLAAAINFNQCKSPQVAHAACGFFAGAPGQLKGIP
jgi:hypothetical protein